MAENVNICLKKEKEFNHFLGTETIKIIYHSGSPLSEEEASSHQPLASSLVDGDQRGRGQAAVAVL